MSGFTGNITSNYVGDHAGQYIAACLKSADSLDYLTVLENIKYKRNMTKLSSTGLVKDDACTFVSTGELVMAERVLTPKNMAINVDLCRQDLLSEWQANSMNPGAWNRDFSNDFTAFIMGYMADTLADYIESQVWSGNAATTGEIGSFTHASAGSLFGDATVVDVAAATLTSANIVAQIRLALASVPSCLFGKEDLYIYMNHKTYRFYVESQAALTGGSYMGLGSMNDGFVPMFEGVKIATCPGLLDDQMVVAQKSNLFFGTDLLGDSSEIRTIDMRDVNGDDTVRVIVRFTGGTQHAIGSDIVWYS